MKHLLSEKRNSDFSWQFGLVVGIVPLNRLVSHLFKFKITP